MKNHFTPSIPQLPAILPLLIFIFSTVVASGQNQSQLSIQGILKNSNGAAVSDGEKSITFSLYTEGTGGTSVWSEVQDIDVNSGVYSAILGTATPLDTVPFDVPYYLGVAVGSEAEMTPRSLLTAAPYALSLIGTENKFPNAGNVGIGTLNPMHALHVVGSAKIEGPQTHFQNNVGIGAGTEMPATKLHIRGGSLASLSAPGYIALGDTAQTSMAIDFNTIQVRDNGVADKLILQRYGGNVGIGSGFADTKLHVTSGGEASLTGNGYFLIGTTGAINMVMDANEIQARNNGSASNLFFNLDGGNVGIGGGVSRAKVEIHGSVDHTHFNYAVFREKPNAQEGELIYLSNPGDRAYGLWVHERIAAKEYHTQSDARIKNIIGRTDNEADLATLREIEITDYQYKDHIANGTTPQKKVIAQQVAEVFPQAVNNQNIQFVPDIMTMCETKDGWVKLPGHDLAAGDRVRVLFAEGEKETEVVEVSQNAFRTTAPCEGEVFVYGREVHDFHVVDYTALSMLNISAVQELARQNETLQQRVKDLEDEKKQFQATIEELKAQAFSPAEMAALRGLLNQ